MVSLMKIYFATDFMNLIRAFLDNPLGKILSFKICVNSVVPFMPDNVVTSSEAICMEVVDDLFYI